MVKEEVFVIKDLLKKVSEVLRYIKRLYQRDSFTEYLSLFEDVCVGVKSINKCLFWAEDLENFVIEVPRHEEEIEAIVHTIEDWIDFIRETVESRSLLFCSLDENMIILLDYAKYVSEDIIFEQTKSELMNLEKDVLMNVNAHYQEYAYMWGSLNTEQGCFDVIHNRISVLKEHNQDFRDLYGILGDYRSKNVLYHMLHNWIFFDFEDIIKMKEMSFLDYYDLDLLHCDENEVIVDLGAYIGDSVLDYIATYQKYKKIFCYEITPNTVKVLRENLKGYENIIVRNKGVGKEHGFMTVLNNADLSTNRLSASQHNSTCPNIEMVRLDEDIEEEITLLKMDIEGAEQDAILGSVGLIKKYKPKLLICVYHNNEDIWKIPKMILDIRGDYNLYLRSNGYQYGPSEIVLFGL